MAWYGGELCAIYKQLFEDMTFGFNATRDGIKGCIDSDVAKLRIARDIGLAVPPEILAIIAEK